MFSIGDKVLLKDTSVIATVYDISVPGLVRVKLGDGTLTFFEPIHLHKLPTDSDYETTSSGEPYTLTVVPAIKKIIHNGITTITVFADGTKLVTRPSTEDAAKYDPYVGWCVGVTAKLYGGKEKAKKFYKAHAVVQKEVETAPAPSKTAFEAFAAAICAMGKFSHAIKSDDPAPVEQPEPEASEARKQYDDSVSKRHCYVCDGYHSLSNFAPCKGCWEAGKAGHHLNFTPKPFEE